MGRGSGGAGRSTAKPSTTKKPVDAKASGGGGSAVSTTTKRDSSDTVSESVLKIEDSFRGLPVENGAIFDKDGKLIATAVGQRDYVVMPVDVSRKMMGKGAIFTHNHPVDTSFSFGDFVAASNMGYSEIRAVGTEYRYSMKPPKGKKMSFNKVKASYDKYLEYYKAEYTALIKAGKITVDEGNLKINHDIWVAVAKDTGIIYNRYKH